MRVMVNGTQETIANTTNLDDISLYASAPMTLKNSHAAEQRQRDIL